MKEQEMGLPEGWEITTLEHLGKWGSGGTPNRKYKEYYDGDIPWVKTGDLGEKYLSKASEYISESGLKNSSAKMFPKGSIALAMYGATIGKVSILDINASTNQACAVIIPNEKTDTEYLYYFLLSQKETFIEKGKGGAQPNISQTIIKEHKIPFPSLPEQQHLSQKLAALLDGVAEAKQRLEKIPALLKQFRQSVLANAVKPREEWESEILKNLTTKIGSGSTPKGGNDVYQTSGIPFVRSLNIHTHFIKYDDLVFIDEVQAEKLKNVTIEENDILLNITGASIGRVNIAPKEFIKGRVNQHVAIIRLKQEMVLPKFLHLILASPKFQKWVEGENYGTTRQALTKGMLEELEISYPEITEQTQIIQKVETYFALANKIETEATNALEKVNLLTQSILAKAFRGELSADWRAENNIA